MVTKQSLYKHWYQSRKKKSFITLTTVQNPGARDRGCKTLRKALNFFGKISIRKPVYKSIICNYREM
jgi:hypothetical protein